MDMDVTLVAGRRPHLLERTLASFQERLFSHFKIGRVFVNIDPFCGTDEDGDACEALVKAVFPSAEIRRPERPSFGLAVKTLWSKPASRFFFHMEDDWILLEDITPERIEPMFTGRVVQVQLSSKIKLRLPHTYYYKERWIKILGLSLFKKTDFARPLFSTSPSFVLSEFAHQCALLMDPAKDPEKQLYSEIETPLSAFTRGFQNHPLLGPGGGPVVEDLGREWLSGQGVRKVIRNEASLWEPLPSEDQGKEKS